MKLRTLARNRKGATIDNFYAMAQMFGLAIFLLLMWYFWSVLTTPAMDVAIWDQSSIGPGVRNNGLAVMNGLDMLFLMGYFGLHIGVIILAFLLRSHPVVYVAGIFLIVILVLVAVPLSNAWEDIVTDSTFVSSVTQLPKTNFLMRQLPTFELVWGFLTLVCLAAMSRGDA